MQLKIGFQTYDTTRFEEAKALHDRVKKAEAKILWSLFAQITHQAKDGALTKWEKQIFDLIVKRLDEARQQAREKELGVLKALYQKHKTLPLKSRDELVQRLRARGFPLQAERVLLSCFDHLAARDESQVGWPVDFPKQPGKVWEKLKSRPNLDLYLIPKFRGIHYRGEPTSRFSDQEKYNEHVQRDEKGEPSFSPAIYKMSPHFDFKRSTRGRRPYVPHKDIVKLDPDAASMMLRTRILRRPFFTKGLSREQVLNKYILPMLAQDLIDREIDKKRRQRDIIFVDKNKRKRPARQVTQAQYEQQIYVNQYGTYSRALSKLSRLPDITQVSTSDNPYHAAMYAFGAKFSTQEELKAKDKDDTTGNNAGVRRTTGTVGKIYTYLFPPEDLYRLQPNLVMAMQQEKEVAIKPLQRWEVETTFIGEIPGQYLCAQNLADIPEEKQAEYTKKEQENKGQHLRTTFSEKYAKTLWEQAEALAEKQRKILVPHGILIRIFGDDQSVKAFLSVRDEQHKKEAYESLARMKDNIELRKPQERAKIVVETSTGISLTYTRVPTPGDGNCLFHAVSLVVNSRHDNGALRRLAVAYMRDHLLDFHFYEEADFANMEQQARGALDEARWGGQPEIYALASALGRRIVVHSPLYANVHPNGYVIDPAGSVNGLDIHIFYNGGDHYEALL